MSATWGLAATISAPVAETLRFAAWHLEAGAHRLYLYLDDANRGAYDLLKAHPKLRPVLCDASWWNGKRPKKHQVRQGQNATHAYHRKAEVDWLIHMDVDEFLVSDSVAESLSALPADQLLARIRPMEQLAGDGTCFKAFIPPGPQRARIVADLYPGYGASVPGGFLSHLAGKVFVRTGLPDIRLQIHNAFQDDVLLEGPVDTAGIALAHCHAIGWESWLAKYRFRLERGAYRAELGQGSLHALLRGIEAREGEAGLRAFFDSVCADTPELRARLDRHGLLRRANLEPSGSIVSHFPGYMP